MRAYAKKLLIIASAIIAGTAITASAMFMTGSGSMSRKHATAAGSSPKDVTQLVIISGLTPDVMAAAGLTSASCEEVFTKALADSFGVDRQGAYEAACRNHAKACSNATLSPERRVKNTDGKTPIDPGQAQNAVSTIRSEAFAALTAGLPTDRVAMAAKIIENRRKWDLPIKYLVVDRTEDEWVALRGALCTVSAAQNLGVPISQPAQDIVDAANRHPAVQEAERNLASGLQLVEQAWQDRAVRAIVP